MFMKERVQSAKQQVKFRMAATFKTFSEALYFTLLFVLLLGTQ